MQDTNTKYPMDSLVTDSDEVLFQDVDVPEVSGMTLLDRIKEAARSGSAIVFVTGFQQRPCCRIAIKLKGRTLFIDPAEIVVVEAEGNYVSLQREADSYLLRESISVIAEKLKPYGFIRIHRSILVNVAFVQEIRPQFTGEYALRVQGGKEYPVTRTYKKNLKLLAQLWISDSEFEHR